MVADRTPDQADGFLRLRRREVRVRRPDGSSSATMLYDSVDRRATDAVVMVLHDGAGSVLLRTAIRPPVSFRAELTVPELGPTGAVSWELPAGLVEADEQGEQGLRRCAARETLEEAGFEIDPGAFRVLGAPIYLSPGVIAERLYFYEAQVDPEMRGRPLEDGSPMEEGAAVRFFPLDECLARSLEDAKTELGLLRLWRAQR